jgi:hypothetical protein
MPLCWHLFRASSKIEPAESNVGLVEWLARRRFSSAHWLLVEADVWRATVEPHLGTRSFTTARSLLMMFLMAFGLMFKDRAP